MDYCGAGSVKDFMKHSPRSFTEKEVCFQPFFKLHSV